MLVLGRTRPSPSYSSILLGEIYVRMFVPQ